MKIDKIYNTIEIKENNITLDGRKYSIKKGKHSIWIPEAELKIPWTLNGKITPFNDWEKGKHKHEIKYKTFNMSLKAFEDETLLSIVNEYTIFTELSKMNMAPKVKGLAFIKNVISDFYEDQVYHDKIGAYAYIMEDANKLRDGEFKFYESEYNKYGYYHSDYLPSMVELHFLPRLNISKHAIGDMKKKDNVINGYLIDVRRTIDDMMVYKDLDKSQVENIRYRK